MFSRWIGAAGRFRFHVEYGLSHRSDSFVPKPIHMKPFRSRLAFSTLTTIVLASCLGQPLSAATFTWDTVVDGSAVTGGAGNWDAGVVGTANWTQDAGVTNVTWPVDATENEAIFGGTSGNVAISGSGVTANALTFSTTGYTISSGTLSLNGITPTVTSAVTATISSSISGTTGLVKSGNGTLILSGDNSALSGNLVLTGGTSGNNAGAQIQNSNAIGGITSIEIQNNTFFGLSGATTGSGVSYTVNGGGGTAAPTGAIRGVAGANVVNGPVSIASSTVRFSNIGAAVSSLTFNGAVTSTNPAYGLVIRNATSQGVIFTNASNSWGGLTDCAEGSVYFTPGSLPSTSALQVGSVTATDFGTNGTFTRALGSAAGEIRFTKANDGQRANGFSARGADLTVNLGGSAADIIFLTTLSKTNSSTATTASTTVTLTDATGVIAGMSVTGTGVPTDTVVSTVAGNVVTLNKAATIAASVALTFYAAQDNTRYNSSVLTLNGANATNLLTVQNPLDLNGANRVIQTTANTATLTGGLKNSSATPAGLRKLGAGTLSHDPGSTHTVSLQSLQTSAGTFEVKSGTLTVTSGASTGYAVAQNGFTVSGGTFRLSGGTVNAKVANFVFTAGTTNASGTFIQDGGTFDAGSIEVLNAYGSSGSLTVNGGTFICGQLRVGQSTGILNLNGGITRVNNLSSGGGTTTVNFNGGTLQAKATNATFMPTTLTTTQIRSGGAVFDSNGFNITILKALTEDSGSTGGGLSKIGTGNLTLSVANSYTGTTTFNAGVLEFASGGLGTTGPLSFTGSSTLRWLSGNTDSLGTRAMTVNTGVIGTLDTLANVVTLTSPIGGAGQIGKAGSGTLKLDGANTFTGGITMGAGDNGWIEVDNAADLGTGAKTANLNSSTGTAIGGFRLLGDVTVSGVAMNLGGRNISAATQHAILNVSGNNVWTGNINISNSGGSYYLRSDSGRLEFSGTLSNAQAAAGAPDTRAFNLEGAGDFLISGTLANGANANRFTALAIDGSGTTTLTGTNTYTGTTSVNAGKLLVNGNNSAATGAVSVNGTSTLGGTGTIGGAITVASTAKIDPGATIGTLTASGATTVNGKLAIQLNGSSADQLAVTGTLSIASGTLEITAPGAGATQPVYIIAKYGTLSGAAFATVTGIPSGYTLNYAYNDGISSKNIALVGPVTNTPYSTWAGTTYSLTGDDALAGSDPDGDGVKNIVEFALNGNPTSGSNNGLTSTLIQDASAPTGDELTYTFAVRDGATFTSGVGGSQTATVDGVVYTVQGSVDLSGFASAVSVIGSASDTAPGLPSLADTAWEYRTFKLDASEGLGGKGFLRVKIETAP